MTVTPRTKDSFETPTTLPRIAARRATEGVTRARVPPPLRVAIVHDWLTGYRGGEKCLEAACRLFPEAPLYTLLYAPGTTTAAIESHDVRTSFLNRLPGVRNYYRYLLPLMPWAVESLALPGDVDLVLSFSHAFAKSVKVPPGVPHLSYCFTPMRYAWGRRGDYVGTAQRSWRAPRQAVKHVLLDRIRTWDERTSGRVTKYLAVSQTVAGRIESAYRRTCEVVYPPVDTDFFRPADGPRDDHYLCLSALVPYKRIDLAIDACRRLGRRLIVIGTGPELRRLRKRGGDVEFLGWRSAEEVREHLRRCRALLFPGHEDFGIVPVEAQACGTPVIALAEGGATETIVPPGDRPGSGFFFPEPTADSLAEAIVKFEAAPDQVSAERGRENALRFSADRFAERLADNVAKTASGGRQGESPTLWASGRG